MRFLLTCVLLFGVQTGWTDNLVLNPDFGCDDFGKIRAWALRNPEDVSEREPGRGPDGSTALRLGLDKGRQFIQSGLRLAPGEPYRLSLDVRAQGFPRGAVEFMVRNPSWNCRAPKIPLPGDTKGTWQHVEVSNVVEKAQEGSYYVSFYLAKPTPGASLEIACPRLEPLSEKARLAPRSPEPLSPVKARLVPIDPLLADLDADEASMTWYYGGFLEKPESAYCLESSLDGGPWVSAPLTAERRVRLSHGKVAPGRHALRARIVAADGSFARTNAYEAIAVRHGLYPEGRRLNNFVTELLAVPLADGTYRFAHPRRGNVYFDLGAAEPTAEVRLDAEPSKLIAPGRGIRSEAVRMLEAGEHVLTVTGVSQKGLTLRVHAVRPVPHHGSSLHRATANVKDYLYGRDFYDRFLPIFYTEVGAPRTKASRLELPPWLALRGAALTSEFDFTAAVRSSPEAALAKIRANGAFDEGLDVWLDELGVVHPRDDHVNLGETLWRIQRKNAVNVWWADAIRGWFVDPATYATEIAGTVNSGEGRGSLYAEVYPAMLATEEATYAQETNFIRFANSAAKLVPAAYRHTTFCFSGYIAPEGWNTYPAPEGDYKVFFDHFMHRLATDPAFAGAGGLGTTAFQHIDEEQVRFIAKLIRHYALEGRTDSLAERYGWKYAPGHLRNCDFAEGLKGWTAVAAEPGSVVAAEKKGYGFKVQFRREVPQGYGDRLVKLTRSAKGPNLLKQALTGLKPGAYYILSYHSTDEADVDRPGTPCHDFVLRAELKGATVMPKLSFDRRWPEDLNDEGRRRTRPNDLKAHPLACQHRYVFRANGPTAELTLSDWASETEPGAPVGRTRLVNYVILRPYYLESEAQRVELEAYLEGMGDGELGGRVVSLQTPGQRAYFAMDRVARENAFSNMTFRAGMLATDDRPAPVALDWRAGTPPYAVTVTRAGRAVWSATVPTRSAEVFNLEIARAYEWTARDAKGGVVGAGRFRTADEAPRILLVPGVPNVRDLGGRIGLGGRRIRQGRVFRSAGWNNNATAHVQTNGLVVTTNFLPGASRLDPTVAELYVRPLGIRTDLDLRSDRECFGMTGSPLGKDVRWVHVSSGNYWDLAKPKWQAAFAEAFRVFLDEANYPIVFHCIAGADRTGSLACILNGLLGVPEDELAKDWEATGFDCAHPKLRHDIRWDPLIEVFDAYPGATLNDRIAAYVRACGFTDADIARFRSLML